MAEDTEPQQSSGTGNRAKNALAPAVAFGLIAALYLVNLDTPTLWADEAETAAMSRNVLIHGVPIGFDGRNLLTYDNCGQLGQGLVSKRVTWLQYYVGAASQWIFGETTRGARLLYVIFGALGFFPLLGLLRGRVAHPVLVSTLLMLTPQVVLFQRSGRYYPLLILLSLCLLRVFYASTAKPRLQFSLTLLVSALLFHTHPLMAAGFSLSLCLASALVDRPRLPLALAAAAAGVTAWGIWYALLPGIDQDHLRFSDLLVEDFPRWFEVFGKGWIYALVDFDFSNSLPLMAVIALLCFCAWRRLPALERLLRDPLFVLIALDLAVQTLLTSALVGAESRNYFALIRYMPHLTLLLGVSLYLLIRTATGPGLRAWFVLAMLAGSNLASISFWLDPLPGREHRVSWWPAIYGEILNPPPDALASALARLRALPADADDVLYVSPLHMADTMTFYLGARFLISPFIETGSACEADVVRTIGEPAYARSTATPRYIAAFEPRADVDVPGYTRFDQVAMRRQSPTATRPELARHGFDAPESEPGFVLLYRALDRDRAQGNAPGPERGIVLITLDTARGDLFDWSDPTTFPHIKDLFEEGARFEQAISGSPVTGPAHASLFSGLPATRHGVLSNHLPLEHEVTTLAEHFQQLGYRTGGFVGSSILGAGRGFEQGFEHYDADFESAYAQGHYERDAASTTERALAWLEAPDARPFLIWLHYFDAHAPYAPPEAFWPRGFDDLDIEAKRAPSIARLQRIHREAQPLPRRESDYYRALYRGQLEFVDQQIGRLRDHLATRLPDAEITWVLTADHGEELGDHMNFYEHNLSLYDGVLRVPLAIRGPSIRSERVLEQVDPAGLVATLLELSNAPVPPGIAPSWMDGEGRAVARVGAKELHPAVRPWAVTLRAPPCKHIYWEDGREELYDIAVDPGERRDLSTTRTEQRARMRDRVEDEILPGFATPEVEQRLERGVGPEMREMLRALGYL